MDWWVHGIRTHRTFQQLMNAGGRSNGCSARNPGGVVISGGIASGLGRRKVMVVLMRRVVDVVVKVLMDLILIKTI